MSLTPEHILEHGPFLRGLARSLLRDAGRADDVVQEAWLAALRRPQEVRDLRPWLVGVVRNLVRRDKRASARREAREQQVGEPSPTRKPADVLETEEARRRLVDALLALDEPYRTPLLLRYYDDLPPREIARRLGVPGSTVRTRIQRGLEQLRQKLDANHGGDRRAWCLALVPLALDPHAGAAIAGTVFTGVVSMKIKVSIVALALCACVFLFFQLSRADAPSRQRSVAQAPVEVASSVEADPKPDANTAEAPDTSETATIRLLGIVRIDGGASSQVEVSVRSSDSEQSLDASAATDREFASALDPLFADGAPKGLEVTFAHADAKSETRFPAVRLDPRTGEPVLPRMDVTLRRVARARGVVLISTGEPAVGTTIAAFPMDGEQPEAAAVASVITTEDGSFELRVPGEGAHLLVAVADGYRPQSRIVEVTLDEPAVLQPFALVPGAAVTGRVTLAGSGALSGATVRAMWEGSALNLDISDTEHQLCFLDGRVEHRSVSAKTDREGVYRVGGLMVADYETAVTSIPEAHHGLTAGGYKVALRAPRAGVDFEVAVATIDVVVRANGRPLEGAKIEWIQHIKTPVSLTSWSNFVRVPANGRDRRRVIPGGELTIKVEADGMRAQKRDLRAPAAGARMELVFDMEPAHAASLLVTLDALADPAPPVPPVMSFALHPLPEGEVVLRTSRLKNGLHVVSQIEPGRYKVIAYPGRRDYYFPVSVEVTVAPNTALPLTMRPRVGGRLHVLYVSKDGRTDRSAFVKVVYPNGEATKDLRIFKDDGTGGSTMWANSLPDVKGPGRIRRVFEPGVYRVLLEPYDESIAKMEREVRVVAGKTIVVEFR